MNIETRKFLHSKVNDIDDKIIKLKVDLDTAERNLKNYQGQVNSIQEQIKSLQNEKNKITEDISKDKIKEEK